MICPDCGSEALGYVLIIGREKGMVEVVRHCHYCTNERRNILKEEDFKE